MMKNVIDNDHINRDTISCLFLRFVLVFMKIALENFTVSICKKRVYTELTAYLGLFFTSFVLVSHKIFTKRAYW